MYHIKDKDFIRGKVPMTKEEIRAFDKVFIGGSGGNLSEIINYSYENLKEGGIIALNFIVLENTFEALECLKKSKFEDIDISQIIVAKNRKVKDFNMMMSENPIYVISARK